MEQDTTATTNANVQIDIATAQKLIQDIIDSHALCSVEEFKVEIVPPTPSVYVFVEGGIVTGAVGTHDVDVNVYDRDDRDSDPTLYYSEENFPDEDDKPEWMVGLDTSDCEDDVDVAQKRADAHEAWIRANHPVVVY
jgi:hypothetical protein